MELPAIGEQVERALRERSGFSLYFRIRRHRGSAPCWTHAQDHVVCDPEGRPVRVIGIIRDATQELRAVDQTEQLRIARNDRRRQADVVGHVSDALAPALTVEDVAEALTTTRLMEQIGASSIFLGLVDNGRMGLVGANRVSDELIRDFHVSRLNESLPLTDAARTREAVLLTGRTDFVDRYPAVEPYLTTFPRAAAAVFLPLIAHDTPIGAVGLTYEGRSRFPQDERTCRPRWAQSSPGRCNGLCSTARSTNSPPHCRRRRFPATSPTPPA
ncbi:GAF domain-containing protein [Streptomyces sp. NPDC058378]|uniref:GAF domain-containing protein n=1 Tax=Streptomyces sp. NPDC058378 TaxID=3346469 RepID=UPI0036594282